MYRIQDNKEMHSKQVMAPNNAPSENTMSLSCGLGGAVTGCVVGEKVCSMQVRLHINPKPGVLHAMLNQSMPATSQLKHQHVQSYMNTECSSKVLHGTFESLVLR